MRFYSCLLVLCLLSTSLAKAQQANVNLDCNPQKNTEQLVPFSAPLNSPDVRDDGTVTFRLKAPAAKEVRLVGSAILTALGRTNQPVAAPTTLEITMPRAFGQLPVTMAVS